MASGAGVCNKEFGMLNAMGFLKPPPSQHSKILVINLPPASPLCLFCSPCHITYTGGAGNIEVLFVFSFLVLGCPIPVANDPNKVVIPKRSPERFVQSLSYVMEDDLTNNGSQSAPLFGGHQTWKERDDSFKVKPTMKVTRQYYLYIFCLVWRKLYLSSLCSCTWSLKANLLNPFAGFMMWKLHGYLIF